MRALSAHLLVLAVAGLGAVTELPTPAAHSTASASCLKGSVRAVIAGKQACLKAGQKCKRSLDKQYHRYGFHCHTGRLVARA